MKEEISISICVPAFNEEESLEAAVEDLLNTLLPAIRGIEVIIVNDGSTDSTSRLSEQLASKYPQVKVIHHQRNLGIGASYRDALAIAGGDYFTWFPADHENSAADFMRYLPYLGKKMIVTSHHRGYDPRPFFRRMISCLYAWILNKCFGLNLKFYNGQAVFPITTLRSFATAARGFIFPAEVMIRAIHSGCRVVELPAPMKIRHGGRSKALTLKSLLQALRDIFRILSLPHDKAKTS